jgi:hypothetical protein
MAPDTRPLIAALAWCAVHGRAVGLVYDHAAGRHRTISASVAADKAGAYDHERRAVIEGRIGETLLDHAASAHITAERTASGLKGYDHGALAHYEATVEGDRVSLYDYADQRHHEYAVSGS